MRTHRAHATRAANFIDTAVAAAVAVAASYEKGSTTQSN